MWLMRTEDLIGCGQAAGNGCALAGAGRRAFASGAIPPLLRAWGASSYMWHQRQAWFNRKDA
jgi:hypothetical protein